MPEVEKTAVARDRNEKKASGTDKGDLRVLAMLTMMAEEFYSTERLRRNDSGIEQRTA